MPIYEYICKSCEHEFEEVQKFSETSLEKCPDCAQNTAERQVSMSSFHLKGGGWYKDGYSNNKSELENTTGGTKNREKERTEERHKERKK